MILDRRMWRVEMARYVQEMKSDQKRILFEWNRRIEIVVKADRERLREEFSSTISELFEIRRE